MLPYSFVPYLLRPAAIHQFRSHSLPRMARAFPAPNQDLSLSLHSSYQIMISKVTLSPFSNIFRQVFWSCVFPGIFMYLLPLPHLIHRYFSASVHHSIRCSVSSLFLSTKINFFIWLAFSWHLYVVASSSTSHTSIPICFRTPLCTMPRILTLLFHEDPLFFRFGPELFTILPFLL